MKNLKIGVFCGGASSERKISIRSGRAVRSALTRLGFSTCSIDPIKKNAAARYKEIDVAFIALHGEGGEDGSIQTQLEKAGVLYVGSDSKSSKRAFDKILTKRILIRKRIPTPRYRLIQAGKDPVLRTRDFPTPFFVKPLREGSSIGIYEVRNSQESADKLRETVRKYRQFFIEEKVQGREFTVGILGKRALPVVELKPKGTFYDYRSKYTKGMTEYLVPAPIPEKLAGKLQKIALRVHQALGTRDLLRVDMMVDSRNRPFVLEANSIPGFTEFSLLPKAARNAGISFEKLCFELIRLAYKRKIKK